MIRQFRRLLPMVLAATLFPNVASADGILRWIGRLSGPGPFWGLGGEFALHCYGVNPPPDPEPAETPLGTNLLRFPCPKARLHDRHVTLYLNVSGAVAENNPLNYRDAGGQSESTAVRLLKVGMSLDWTVHKALDIGAGGGVVYFAGPRFANFSRGYVQPLRLTLRPLLLWTKARDKDGWLLFSANRHILLGIIDGADFGAPSDTFRSQNEQDWEFGVSVDVLRLVRRIDCKDKQTTGCK